ncbi:hypothetical protein [Streptomyces sp. NPDC014006]|uniref:hypothetical protein n=1 Tax=Streptomyces sp. NPDC014006 TaxID=3364870 RepID=UPI0037008ED4
MRRWWNDTAGRLSVALAVLFERLAGREATRRVRLRRNEALRRAHQRGVPVEVLAARLGLTPAWVRSVIRNPEKAALEEAA